MVDQDLLVASNFDNFSVTKYRRYVIKLHVDIPETQQQASQILITSPPSDHPRYKNYTYFEDAPGRFCVGYNVDTIDNTTFMPVYSSKISKNRSLLNLEFTQEYKSYLQKKMWKILCAIMSIENTTIIRFCGNLISTKSSIPIEIAHMIYRFL